MAWRVADSAAWWRRALASARKDELSARAIAGALILERFQGGDDPVQVGLDAAQVLGEPELSFVLSLGDEAADNTSFLAQANTRRHEAALAAARHAIEQLRREGRAVTYAAVAHTAGVSRPWLYRQDQVRDLISQPRDRQLPATALTAQRATTSSLRQRLDTAQAEITRLRAENRTLRDQLARHLGMQRTQNGKDAPPGPP